VTQKILKSIVTLSMSLDGKILGEWDDDQVKTLLKADAVNELRITLVPVIVGGAGNSSLSGLPGDFLQHDLQFRLKGLEEMDGSLQLHYVRTKKLK
jgi:riboflavin biosynthesis pyrimidine reductase